MKKLTVPCEFAGEKLPTPIYVGEPSPARHPLHYQSIWLRNERGGTIPEEVMSSFGQLQKMALENAIPFEDLCTYALEQAENQDQPAEPMPPPNGESG